MSADLILHHGLVTTLDRTNPNATAIAIRDSKFLAVGDDRDIMALAGPETKVIDLKGKRVLPGLIDNHTHVVPAVSTTIWSCAGTGCALSPMRWTC